VRDVDIHLLRTPDELRSESIEVSGEAFRHLFRARRLERGQRLRVVDGAGAARFATVEVVGRSAARLRLEEPAPARQPNVAVELAVAWIRPERAAWVVEKATELGVRAVRSFPCARAQTSRGAPDLARLRRVAAAALEQCGGATLPVIEALASFEELLAVARDRRSLVLDIAASAASLGPEPGAERPWLVIVGPEGGFQPEEVGRLVEAGARPLSLGPRILRSETAALVGAALLLHGQPPRRGDEASGAAGTRPDPG
jgi:16S rRNA (uracil1498-N3)-methyltransferase